MKRQREALLTWISEGLETDEINIRAALFEPPFAVTRQNVDKYRKSRRVKVAALQDQGELDALMTGLARKDERIRRLARLAERLEQDLFDDDAIWLEQQKSIGSGPFTRIVTYEEFNASEVQQYRGLLDDIAKEVGDRRQVQTNVNIDYSTLSEEQLARIAAGEDPAKVVAKP